MHAANVVAYAAHAQILDYAAQPARTPAVQDAHPCSARTWPTSVPTSTPVSPAVVGAGRTARTGAAGGRSGFEERLLHLGPAPQPVRRTSGMRRVAAQPSGKAAPEAPSYLHTAEVADILQVSPKTVSRWAKEGKLPFLKTSWWPGATWRRRSGRRRAQVQPTACWSGSSGMVSSPTSPLADAGGALPVGSGRSIRWWAELVSFPDPPAVGVSPQVADSSHLLLRAAKECALSGV